MSTLTDAQRKALRAALAREDANKRKRQRMHDRGEPIAIPTDDNPPAVECDLRSAGPLIEAGMLRLARGFDCLFHLTPKGREEARR